MGRAEDGARAAKYAAAYKAAGGPRLALVDRWAAFIQKPGAGRLARRAPTDGRRRRAALQGCHPREYNCPITVV